MSKITRRIIITVLSFTILTVSILITWQSLSSYQEEKEIDTVVGIIQPQSGWNMTHEHRVGTGILCVSYSSPCQSAQIRYDTNKQVTQKDIVRSFPGVRIESGNNNCATEKIQQGKLCVTRVMTDKFEVNINVSNHSDMKYRIIYNIRPIE